MATEYGIRLRAARKHAKLTQNKLSEITGIPQSTISTAENLGHGSAETTVYAMACGVNAHWLASGEGEMLSQGATVIATLPAATIYASSFDTQTVHIPYYDTGGAMGHGIVLRDQPGVIREMSVSKEWLQSNVRGYTSSDNLCLVTGFGDSMRPLFMSGDPVIVDKGVTEFRGDGLYFFRVENEGFIKRLQSIPGRGLVVISENPSYESWSIDKTTTDFQVLGKVIKAWCGCDF